MCDPHWGMSLAGTVASLARRLAWTYSPLLDWIDRLHPEESTVATQAHEVG